MAPKVYVNEDEQDLIADKVSEKIDCDSTYKLQIVWRNVIIMSFVHLGAIYGLYCALTDANWKTNVLAYFFYIFSGLVSFSLKSLCDLFAISF